MDSRVERKKKYESKRVRKPVSFNTTTDQALLDFVNSVDFSKWVKDKIKQEIKDAR